MAGPMYSEFTQAVIACKLYVHDQDSQNQHGQRMAQEILALSKEPFVVDGCCKKKTVFFRDGTTKMLPVVQQIALQIFNTGSTK